MAMEDSDLPYEEDVLNKPHSEQNWKRYLEHLRRREASKWEIWLLYERALLNLPRNEMLWKEYLEDRKEALLNSQLSHEMFTKNTALYGDSGKQIALTNGAYERALDLNPLCIGLWVDYVTFLLHQRRIGKGLGIMDKALQTLPILEHSRLWQLYTRIADGIAEYAPQVSQRIWKRYVKLEPTVYNWKRLVDASIQAEMFDEAASGLQVLVDLDKEESEEHVYRLCLLAIECPPKTMPNFPVEQYLREAMTKFTGKQGELWCTLGTFFVRIGDLERAEQVFEEALRSVVGAHDFAQVFEAYTRLEESLLKKFCEDTEMEEFVERTMSNLERILAEQPLLLVEARLRQLPNRIDLWLQKMEILINTHRSDVNFVKDSFENAIEQISKRGKVNPFPLYLAYAKWAPNAHVVLESGISKCKEEAEFWIGWSQLEPELRDKIAVLERGCRMQKRNWKLWLYFLDLIEAAYYENPNLVKKEQVIAVYEGLIENKTATPEQIASYAAFIEAEDENSRSEMLSTKVFKIYHRGIELLRYPGAYELWNLLLPRAVNAWGESKFERVRELFEEALAKCPPEFQQKIYLLYGDAEERFGLARSAIQIYQRAAQSHSLLEKKGEMFRFAVSKAKKLLGLSACRPVLESAISPATALLDDQVREFCLEFCGLEVALGEIERARTLFAYGAQLADPKREEKYWERWHEFETQHGNEDSFREMLRIKRAVQAKFDQNPYFVRATDQNIN